MDAVDVSPGAQPILSTGEGERSPRTQNLEPRTPASAGLYVHFPYCVSICNYCDFDRQATGFASIPRYVQSVVAEIKMQRRRPLHSIFFGGGTPSLMTAEQTHSILTAAAEAFDVLPGCEITLEANPGECTVERLSGFR